MKMGGAGWRNRTVRLRVLLAVLAVALAAAAVIIPRTSTGGGPALSVGESAPSAGTPVCGRPILDSPWDYHGAPGTYTTSGTPVGLPTFGAAGTDFPHARSVLVVGAGDNTAAASAGSYQVNNTLVYFEPGIHTIQA